MKESKKNLYISKKKKKKKKNINFFLNLLKIKKKINYFYLQVSNLTKKRTKKQKLSRRLRTK